MLLNRHNNKLSYALLACLLLSLTACASMSSNKRANLMTDSLSDFRKSLRWGYFDAASQHIKVRDYAKPLRDQDYLKNIRITAYEYGDKSFSEENSKVEVVATISLYDVNRGSVIEMTEKQIWWFDVDQQRWFLDGDLPNFRHALRR